MCRFQKTDERPKEMRSQSQREMICIEENHRRLAAVTSASSNAIVTATKLWLVVLVGEVRDLTIIAK